MKVGRREEERKLVNSLFDRKACGSLILNDAKPYFEKFKEATDSKISKAKQKYLPRSLFMGKFGLTQEAFEVGLRDGDFMECTMQNGKPGYAWCSGEHVDKGEIKNSFKMSHEKSGEKEEESLFQSSMKHFNLGVFTSASSGSSTGLPPLQDRSIKNGGLNSDEMAEANKAVTMAIQAFDKMISEVKRQLNVLGHDQKDDPIYKNLSLGNNLGHYIYIHMHAMVTRYLKYHQAKLLGSVPCFSMQPFEKLMLRFHAFLYQTKNTKNHTKHPSLK